MSQPTVIWEITRRCELECRHCAKRADGRRAPSDELSTYEAYKTVDQIVSLKPARLIISGGDPLMRGDLLQLVDYAQRRGVAPAVVLSPTSNLTAESIAMLGRNGVARLIFSIDGSTPQSHDSRSGVSGAFAATVKAIGWAGQASIPIEINSMVTLTTDLAAIADLISDFDVKAWNVHFLVSAGPSRKLEIITADEAERAFEILATIQERKPFRIRTVEAPHYRRFLLQRYQSLWPDFATDFSEEIAECAIDDVVFIGANGAVRPSEFLPIAAGNLRFRSLFGIVRASDLFVAYRDRSNLTGKCAQCEFRKACGGSRARAWATTGFLFSSDPLCNYHPRPETRQEAAS
ncbi:MAG TPA: radical SAM protein [Thermoanaerobaculia bacterium]|jgi:radical SAM protein with 4Fe4S-binding SPASM domain|nr:radical SAM protein [Thermoanaerobaculia bacterium]